MTYVQRIGSEYQRVSHQLASIEIYVSKNEVLKSIYRKGRNKSYKTHMKKKYISTTIV